MKKVRIGNDIAITWRVFRAGDAEVLAGKQLTVKLLDPYMKPVGFTYKIEDNAITGVFSGRDQKRTGTYSLLLCENYGLENMNTIDECNFVQLVSHTYLEGGTDDTGVDLVTVDLTSDINLPTNGVDGDSAYDIAVANGFTGTEAQWLASLVGTDGKSAYELAKDNGYEGTEAEWLESLKGKDGKSAYEVAVDNGYTGTEAEWLKSLIGKSSYEMVVEGGYTGSQADYVRESLAKVVTSDKFIGKYDISNADDSNAVLYTKQSLTKDQQTIARQNIGAASEEELLIAEDADIEATIADPSLLTSAVRVTEQTWTEKEKEQARENIDVASEERVKILEDKMAILDKTGVSVIGDITTLTTDAKDYIVNAINEVDGHADTNTENIGDMTTLTVKQSDGTAAPDLVTALNILKNSNGMTLVKEAVPNADMVATYTIYNGVDDSGVAIEVGQIDVPYDKVVLSGELVVADGTEIIGKDSDGNSMRSTAGHHYIVLSIANETEKVWIDLATLDYTAKQPMTGETLQVQVVVDAVKREISATIGEDKVGHVELDKDTEAELDFTGYNHDYDDSTNADYGKTQLTTTAQTLREGVNELDELQGDKENLPYRDETDPDNILYPTITENIKKLYEDAVHTYIVDALPTIDSTVKKEDIYILHTEVDDYDELGQPVMEDNDGDGTPETVTTSDYYTPYRLNDAGDAWVCLYHNHEFETTAIDFTTDVTI